MDYRDERDALRGRVENLEQALGEAQREIDARRADDKQARIAQIEQQMAQAQRLLGELGRELGDLKGTPPPQPRRRDGGALIGGLVAAVVGLGALVMTAVLVARTPPRHPRTPAPPPPVAVPPAAPKPVVQPPVAQPPPVEPAPRSAHAVWTAKVTRSTGAGPRVGTACTLEADLDSKKGEPHVAALVVACGGTAIYRSTDTLNGMSMRSTDVRETAGPQPGTLVYALQYDDKGARTGARNEASIDTRAGVASVWRTSVPAFQVELSVAKQSAAVRGEPLAR